MKYLNPKERIGNKEVHEYLSGYVSQSIKHDFPFRTLTKYCADKSAAILDAGASSGAFLRQIIGGGIKTLTV